MTDLTSESKFTPAKVVDETKERDWPASLGMMDWDSTRIVFTKRSLIEFLKYTGTTVDTNFQNIQKLPKYASFGKISGPAPAAAESSPPEVASPEAVGGSDEFKPTRRVRTVPGGASSDIFSHLDDGSAVDEPAPKPNRSPEPAPEPQDEGLHGFSSDFKPSRRVRSNPGGNSSIGSFFEAPDDAQKALPSRRVRQNPGGQDNIGSLW
ncbi:hypothetical protein EV121DRAFT_252553 [Schizophyllum commune]|nr:hypothetical protein K525DRAFT_257435 [Schizophyllum commune Loenen D]